MMNERKRMKQEGRLGKKIGKNTHARKSPTTNKTGIGKVGKDRTRGVLKLGFL